MKELIFLGFCGGLIVDFLQVLELRNKPKEERPNIKEFLNWFPYLVWPFLGALLVYVNYTPISKLTKLLSLQIGAAAPLIIRQMGKSIPTASVIKLDNENQ